MERGVISSLAFGAAVLQREGILVWFPEGERSSDGELQRFRPGLGILLQRHPVPVVPLYLDGTYEALPRGTRKIHRRAVKIRYGEPIGPDALQPKKRHEHADHKESTAQQIVDPLHDAVAEMKS